MIQLQPEEHRALAQYIYSISAIKLDDSKKYLVENRLSGIVTDLSCRSYGELLFRAQSDASGAVRRQIVDAITTNETLFFRDAAPFELLRNKLLPELVDRGTRSGRRPAIRIWSAACSTGQELYSIAIILKEVLGDLDHYDIRLVGTDISNFAVARASKGVFSALEASRGLNDAMLAKYFTRKGADWQIRDELRVLCSFRTFNLFDSFTTLGRFDIVFCRNVAIYFSEPDKIKLFKNLEGALDRDGVLLIGSMESINAICPQFESKRHLRTVFYQLKVPPGGAAPPVGRAF